MLVNFLVYFNGDRNDVFFSVDLEMDEEDGDVIV